MSSEQLCKLPIWNRECDFVFGTLKLLDSVSGVATIGGSNFFIVVTGKSNVRICDDNSRTLELILDDIHYFRNSPVNVISAIFLVCA